MQALDAPGLANDFYSSLLDWSQQGLLGVALGPHLYIYNTVTSKASLADLLTCMRNFQEALVLQLYAINMRLIPYAAIQIDCLYS